MEKSITESVDSITRDDLRRYIYSIEAIQYKC